MERAAERYWNERRFKGLSSDPRTWSGVYAAMVDEARDTSADLPEYIAPAPTISEAMDALEFGLMFALCNRDHAGTRRDVKKAQEHLRRLRELQTGQEPVATVVERKDPDAALVDELERRFASYPRGSVHQLRLRDCIEEVKSALAALVGKGGE